MTRDKYINIRRDFCKLALENPEKAANKLRSYAKGLENSRNTSDIVEALKTIFAVSERTIYNDFSE